MNANEEQEQERIAGYVRVEAIVPIIPECTAHAYDAAPSYQIASEPSYSVRAVPASYPVSYPVPYPAARGPILLPGGPPLAN